LIDLTTDGWALSNSKAAIPAYVNRAMMRRRRKYSVKPQVWRKTPLTAAFRCAGMPENAGHPAIAPGAQFD
jgi:hypothetical protein